ncbi:hypothetical protein LCGC14_1827860, partial [marine sediment metagenome]
MTDYQLCNLIDTYWSERGVRANPRIKRVLLPSKGTYNWIPRQVIV